MPARQLFELRNIVRVRQESYVEDQVAVGRNAVAKAKAVHVDHDLAAFLRALKIRRDERSKLVHIELRRIDPKIRQASNRLQLLALVLQAAQDGRLRSQRMRPARLAEAAP